MTFKFKAEEFKDYQRVHIMKGCWVCGHKTIEAKETLIRRNETSQRFLWTEKFVGRKERRNLHVASSKARLAAVSMGRTPAEQLQRQAMAPHERFLPEGGGGQGLDGEESQLFPRWKAKRSSTVVCGTRQNIWQTSALWKTFFGESKEGERRVLFIHPPPTCHAPITPPPWPACVIVWAPRVQSGPFRSRSVCTDTM